jgi:hypothetical protein
VAVIDLVATVTVMRRHDLTDAQWAVLAPHYLPLRRRSAAEVG